MTAPRLIADGTSPNFTRRDDPSRWFSRQLVLFLQKIVREDGGQHFPRWSPDENETEILITDEVPIRLDSDARRVGIQLMTGLIQNMNLSFNHMLHRSFLTGKTTHMDLWQGQAALNVHSFNDDESRAMAHRLAYKLQRDHLALIRMADLHMVGRTQSFGPTTPPAALVRLGEGSPDSFMCSVTFPFFFKETWTKEPKEVPHGENDPYFGQGTAQDGVSLEDPPTLQQYLVNLSMYPMGEFEGHAEDLRQTLRDGRNVVTSSGRVYRTVQIMDGASESLSARDHTTKNHEIIKK